MAAMDADFLNIEALCRRVLSIHEQHFKSKLKIPLHSFIMEVLGHAYAYKILLKLRQIADWPIFRKFSLNACNIDCGDKAHDSNRWFWDLMGYTKPLVFWRTRKT